MQVLVGAAVDGDAAGRARVVVVEVAVVVGHRVVVGDAPHLVRGRARRARLLRVRVASALLQDLLFVFTET